MTPRPPRPMPAIPYAAAMSCGAAAIASIYLAATRDGDAELLPASLVALVGACIVGFLLRNRERAWRLQAQREMVGGWVLTLMLFGASTLAAAEALTLPDGIIGWHLFVLFLACFAVTLGSQRSFLMFAGTSGGVLLAAQALEPRPSLVALFSGGLVLLIGSLARQERAARFPTSEIHPTPGGPLLAVLAVLTLLGGLYHSLPESEPTSPGAVIDHWARRLGITPKVEQKRRTDGSAVGSGVSPSVDPFRVGGSGARVPAAEPPYALTFDGDLKFGNLDTSRSRLRQVALMVRVTNERGTPVRLEEPYWAMKVVTDYDGKTWSVGKVPDVVEGEAGWVTIPAPTGLPLTQEYVLKPFVTRSLIGLSPVSRVKLPRVSVDREGMLTRLDNEVRAIRYTLVSQLQRVDPDMLATASTPSPADRYLRVPADVRADPTYQTWLSRISAARYPMARVRRALQLFASFRYTLTPGLQPELDPTLAFLQARRGYCQHFSSAMALLLRGAGIPSRVVVGYAGGDWHADAQFTIVRRSHAHSWVEVHFSGAGWVPFDPAAHAVATMRPIVRPDAGSGSGSPPALAPGSGSDTRPRPAPGSGSGSGSAEPPPGHGSGSGSGSGQPPGFQPPTNTPRPNTPRRNTPRRNKPRRNRPRPDDDDDGDIATQSGRFEMEWRRALEPRTPRPRAPRTRTPERGSDTDQADATLIQLEAVARHLKLVLPGAALLLLILLAISMLPQRTQQTPPPRPVQPDGPAPYPGAGAYLTAGTPEQRIVATYAALLDSIDELHERDATETAAEWASRLPRDHAGRALTELFIRARYGDGGLTSADAEEAARLLGEIRVG